jgi:hypothetical protein
MLVVIHYKYFFWKHLEIVHVESFHMLYYGAFIEFNMNLLNLTFYLSQVTNLIACNQIGLKQRYSCVCGMFEELGWNKHALKPKMLILWSLDVKGRCWYFVLIMHFLNDRWEPCHIIIIFFETWSHLQSRWGFWTHDLRILFLLSSKYKI